MNKNLTLFDTSPVPVNQYGYPMAAKPLARREDPQTSKAAAQDVAKHLTSTQKLFLEVLGASRFPMTAAEVAAKAYPIEDINRAASVLAKRETLRKRAGELVAANKIKVVDSRECQITGKQAQTYEVT